MATLDEVLAAAAQFHQRGNFSEAERLYREALKSDPQSVMAIGNLGALFQVQKRFDEAIKCYQRVLELQPNHAQAHCNLGSIYKDAQQYDRAIECYQLALQGDPALPEAHFNLGVIRQQQRDLAAAGECYRRAIYGKPDYAQAHNNLGTVYRFENKLAQAMQCYEAALRCRPDFSDAHRNRALLWLLLGDFRQGWPEFEWRLRIAGQQNSAYPQPRWQGEPMSGGTVLLVAEQGLGDTLQFIRYATLVKQQSKARVLVQCSPALHEMLRDVAGVDRLVAPGHAEAPDAEKFDAYVPLLSLPRVFDTLLETVPADVPYLHADSQRVQHWRQELASDGILKVGIGWQGNPDFPGDYYRSVPLEHFVPLADCQNIRLYSLQKGPGHEQLADWGERLSIADLGATLDEGTGAFVGTAAVMMSLDLVITSDTAIAHLAGALGVPVWVALSWVPDWRFLLDREDMPWYPTMRLFRQQRFGDWRGVFAKIADQLRSLSKDRAAKLEDQDS